MASFVVLFDPAIEAIATGDVGDLPDFLDEVADAILARADRFVPVDTGELKASGRTEAPARDVRQIVYGTDHALHVELGTYKMAAQPYLRPALDGLV